MGLLDVYDNVLKSHVEYVLVEELPSPIDTVILSCDVNREHISAMLSAAAQTSPDVTMCATADSTLGNTIATDFAREEPTSETLNSSNDQPLEVLSGPVLCDFCGKTFTTRGKMLWHRRMHEENRPQYMCPYVNCDRKYLSKQSCELHYKQVHCTREQFTPLECSLCHKTFAIPQTLEVHMRYHTRYFPYQCEHCGRKYAQKGHLTAHLQVKHNNLRYICQEPGCVKVFKNSISLRNHSFVHTGMPFRCAYCDKGYPQKSKLKVHLSMKHDIEMSIEELESMRKLKSTRTRHSFVRLESEQMDHMEHVDVHTTDKLLHYENVGEEIEVAL